MELIISYLSRFCMIVGGAALLLLVLLATANVTMRLFGVPFAGTYEIVAFLGALVTAGALAHTQRRRDHIMVDILTDRFPPSPTTGGAARSTRCCRGSSTAPTSPGSWCPRVGWRRSTCSTRS